MKFNMKQFVLLSQSAIIHELACRTNVFKHTGEDSMFYEELQLKSIKHDFALLKLSKPFVRPHYF